MEEDRIIIVWDGSGSLMGCGKVETKQQAELFLSELCEEWFEHCRGDVVLDESDWSSLVNNRMYSVSIIIITRAGDEIELSTRPIRDYTHIKGVNTNETTASS